jgi:hypothetical protein
LRPIANYSGAARRAATASQIDSCSPGSLKKIWKTCGAFKICRKHGKIHNIRGHGAARAIDYAAPKKRSAENLPAMVNGNEN